MTLVTSASFKQPTLRGSDDPFSSPLIHEVVAKFDDTTRHVILEPGFATSGTLGLLQGKRCRLLVANATSALSALDEKSQDKEFLSKEVATLIFDAGKEKIDTVLCWDLLNYLSLPLLKIFTARLAAIMAPGGMVHAYIHSAYATMPQCPQRYTLLGENLAQCLDRHQDARKTPRYSFRALEQNMDGLHIDRSMLLRNGIQEYLLRVNRDQTE